MLKERSEEITLSTIETESELGNESVYRIAYVSPFDVNTLTQPREVFEGIPELAQSIARVGLLSDLHIGLFDETHAIQYLDSVNERWEQQHTLQELKSIKINGQDLYLVLIAGERRLRACRMLLTEGCSEHQEKDGLKPCFELHHPGLNGRIPARVYLNPDYDLQAVEIQESENIHIQLPPGRLAVSIANLWKSRKAKNSELTLEQHARSIGRSVDTVRTALKYAEVPQVIQDLVNKNLIAYGIGVELARLYKAGDDEEDLKRCAQKAYTDRMSVPAFRQFVNNRIKQKKTTEQMDLMAFMKENADRASKAAATKKVLHRQTALAAQGLSQFIDFTMTMYGDGEVTAGNMPFAEKQVIANLVRVAEQGAEVTNKLYDVIGEGDKQRLEKELPIIIRQGRSVLSLLPEEEI